MQSKRIITGSNSNFTVETLVGPYDIRIIRISSCGQKIDLTERQFNEMVRAKIARDLEDPEFAMIQDADLPFEIFVGQRWDNTAQDFGDGF